MTLRRSQAANRDLADIAAWTADRFGEPQARTYGRLIERAVAQVEDDPLLAAACPRPEPGEAVRALHLGAIAGRRSAGRHVIYYRVDARGVGIARILHESGDPMLTDLPDPA